MSGIQPVYNFHAVHIGKLPKKQAVNTDIFPMTSSDFCVWFSICLRNENVEYGRGHVLG